MDRTFYSEQEFCHFAAQFARRLRAGDVVGLSGPLGAGKTTFIKAVVSELLGCDLASSPTFTFWHRYAPDADATARESAVNHLDLYRIQDASEIAELGLEEAFDGKSVVLAEWWRNAPMLLPPVRYEIEIDGSGEGLRRVTVREPESAGTEGGRNR